MRILYEGTCLVNGSKPGLIGYLDADFSVDIVKDCIDAMKEVLEKEGHTLDLMHSITGDNIDDITHLPIEFGKMELVETDEVVSIEIEEVRRVLLYKINGMPCARLCGDAVLKVLHQHA